MGPTGRAKALNHIFRFVCALCTVCYLDEKENFAIPLLICSTRRWLVFSPMFVYECTWIIKWKHLHYHSRVENREPRADVGSSKRASAFIHTYLILHYLRIQHTKVLTKWKLNFISFVCLFVCLFACFSLRLCLRRKSWKSVDECRIGS